MRRYTQTEIDSQAKSLYDSLVGGDSLHNAKKIIRAVRWLLLAEEKRRKNLKPKDEKRKKDLEDEKC